MHSPFPYNFVAMKFNLEAALESLMPSSKRSSEWEKSDDPVCMVMLLRESRVFGLDCLRIAGEIAFGVPFSNDKESKHFVIEGAPYTFMKVGRHTLGFLHYRKPYLGEQSQEFGASMPKASRRKAREQHAAWTAIDYVKCSVDLDLECAVLAKLCLHLIDGNCTGVLLPREHILMPNDGSLVPYLQHVSSCYRPR